MSLVFSRTLPFRRLQSRIGHTTYRLNTVLVGLKCVADGQGDGGAIAVTWSKPKTLELAKQVADQARIFACASALVLGADVLDAFLREFCAEEWLGFAPETRNVATKAITGAGGAEYSVAERAEAICAELGLKDPVKIAALDLLAKWRNVVAHGSDRRARLTTDKKRTLIDAASKIKEKYSHFDIELALKNFESQRCPFRRK